MQGQLDRVRSSALVAAVLVGLAQVVAAQGFAESPFAPPQVLQPATSKLIPVVAGDIDGDGLPDLLARTSDVTGVLVFINHDGTFGAASAYSTPVAFTLGVLQRQSLADLDGDGWLDVATGDAFAGQFQTLLNQGDGTLGLVQSAGSLPGATHDAHAADMDGDGLADLVVGTGPLGSQGKLLLLRGLGDGTVAPAEDIGTPSAVGLLDVADVNADDVLDVVAESGTFGGLDITGFDIFLGAGDGSMTQAPTVPVTGASLAPALIVADLDGDAAPDILGATPLEVAVARGHGDGTFDALVTIPLAGGSVYSSDAVDIDVDGYADLLGGGTTYAQRLGPDLELVGQPVHLGFEKSQVQLTVADFDADGLMDVAYAAHDDHAHVHLNALGPFLDVGYDSPRGLLDLSLEGDPQPGAPGTLLLRGLPAGTPALIVVGLSPVHATVAGMDLVPEVGALLPALVGVPIHERWPETLLPGTLLYLQAFVATAPGPAVSQALVVVPGP